MKVLQILIEVTVAFFAVVGVDSLWRLLMGRLFGSDRMVLAIEILKEEDAARAEWLIRDAMNHMLWLRSGRIVVLTTKQLAQEPSLRAVMQVYGVSYELVEQSEGEK